MFIHFLFGFLHPYYIHLWVMRQVKRGFKAGWDLVVYYIYTWISMVLMFFKIVVHFYEDCGSLVKEKLRDGKHVTKKEKKL